MARPLELDGERRLQVLRRLAPVLGEPVAVMARKMNQGETNTPYDGVVLAEDVDPDLRIRLAERAREFPGVSLEPTYVRTYPERTLAAHVLGYTGPIFAENFERYRSLGYVGNENVGQAGVESEYESYLRGEKGERRVEVDVAGDPVGRGTISATPPTAGDTLRLTVHAPTQRAMEEQLRFRVEDSPTARGAAGVALDPETGEILAIASYPTFSPEAYVRRQTRVTARYNRDRRQPLFFRAIAGAFPPASTFKAITLSTALQQEVVTRDELIGSPPELELYNTVFRNFQGESHGLLNAVQAVEFSSDTYFYTLGSRFYENWLKDRQEVQQEWARRFGFGQPTGIDLPGEAAGRIPTDAWKRDYFPAGSDNDYWKPGDNINMTVGQGYVEATPLQMAVAYSAIANGGRVVSPTIAKEIVSPTGQVVRRLSMARPERRIPLSPATLETVREGLVQAANGPNGTATSVFGPIPAAGGPTIAGKTGTAENLPNPDHSWFVGMAPAEKPRIVVAIVVQNGGTGAGAAAPAVCRTMAAYLDYDAELCGTPPPRKTN